MSAREKFMTVRLDVMESEWLYRFGHEGEAGKRQPLIFQPWRPQWRVALPPSLRYVGRPWGRR